MGPAELDSSAHTGVRRGGSVTATVTTGPNGLLARRSGGTTVLYTYDPHAHTGVRMDGSVAQRLDGAGTVLTSHLWDAYAHTGVRRDGSGSASGAWSDPVGYGAQWGYYRDAETGLYLLTHRYYDPGTGRFLTRDPISYAGGINLYGYCGNEPVGWADPEGMNPRLELIRRLFELLGKIISGGRGPRIFPGGSGGMKALPAPAPMKALPAPCRPTRAYDRVRDYGRTPTNADKKAVGGSPDHQPPLVKRYYEGDPSRGEKPGHMMTDAERRASAADRSRMVPGTPGGQRSQGGEMGGYSKRMKKKYGL